MVDRRKTGIWILLLALLLSGCDKEVQEPTVSGTVYDTGQFQVVVPQPWKVFPITDPLAEGQPVKTDSVFLRRGGDSDWHIAQKPYIRIDCYGREEQIEKQIPDDDLQHDPETLPPMKLGDLVWQGYAVDDYQGKARIGRFAVLWAEDAVYTYQVLIWFRSGGDSISLEDKDLQTILAGVKPSGS